MRSTNLKTMNSTQEAKLNMYNAVATHCDTNAAIILTVPAFNTAFSGFKAKISAINSTAQLEAQVITGIATDKKVIRESLAQQATDIAAVVFAYASFTNNNTLKEQVDFSRRDLLRLKDDQLAPTCHNIHDAANGNLAALGTYGITAVMLTAFDDLISDYTAKVPSPRNAAAQRKTYAANLKNLFKECDSILKDQLDKTAVQFKAANLTFYNTYKNNRIILDAATSNTMVKGKITKAQDSSILVAGVAISAEGTSYTATSDANGVYELKIPVPGTYNITFTHADYQPKTINNITVTLGNSTTLDVALTAIP